MVRLNINPKSHSMNLVSQIFCRFFAELMANFTLLHLAGNDAYQDDLYGMVYADESKYSGYRGLETILRKSCPKVMKAKFNAPS